MHTTSHTPVTIHQNNIRKKIRRSASEWRRIIANYKTSGLTQRDFCQQQDIAYSSFTNWLIKLKKLTMDLSAENAEPALFVDVLADKPLLHDSINEWDVELTFANGMVLRLKQGQG